MDDVSIKVFALELDAIASLPRKPMDPMTIDLARRLCKAMPPSPPRIRDADDLRVVDALSETMSRMGKAMSRWLHASILNQIEKERELIAMGIDLS